LLEAERVKLAALEAQAAAAPLYVGLLARQRKAIAKLDAKIDQQIDQTIFPQRFSTPEAIYTLNSAAGC